MRYVAPYPPEIREDILEQMAEGKSLRTICAQEGFPRVGTIMQWCNDDPAWAERYARARAQGDDAMAEDVQAIADDPSLDPNDKRVMIDARKWLLGKRRPKKYGERLELVGDPDQPLVTETRLKVENLSDGALKEIAGLATDD